MLEFNLKDLKISQLGYVYKDIEKQANLLETKMGMPKFGIFENKGNIYKYRGKETTIWTKIALSRTLDKQIELIQWNDGDCIFKEFIESGKEGLHHFGLFVDDINPVKAAFLNEGYEIVHEGTTALYNVVYFDTLKELGLYLEFQDPAKKRRRKK